MAGTLFLVATPIGNLDDLSPRARAVLGQVDRIACEDTRRTGLMLARLGGERPPLVSFHEHNERHRIAALLDRLGAGESIALVSDAGSPLLSDPGYPLVRAVIEAGVRVEVIPGPAAAIVALQLSGLPPLPFTFLGFAPPKRGKRQTFWRGAGALGHTVVVYESPHRILASLDDALAELGPRPAALARELTKLHEEVVRGTLAELRDQVAARGGLKGEIVLVVGGEMAHQGDSQVGDTTPRSRPARQPRGPRARTTQR